MAMELKDYGISKATVNGKTVLMRRNSIVQDRRTVHRQIALLTEQIEQGLPAAKAALDGEKLIVQRREQMDKLIANLEATKVKLTPEAVLTQQQKLIDGKIERLSELRTALAAVVDELEDLPQE